MCQPKDLRIHPRLDITRPNETHCDVREKVFPILIGTNRSFQGSGPIKQVKAKPINGTPSVQFWSDFLRHFAFVRNRPSNKMDDLWFQEDGATWHIKPIQPTTYKQPRTRFSSFRKKYADDLSPRSCDLADLYEIICLCREASDD